MTKDPAFLFYPADASQDTQFMNRLERGAYFDLIKGQRMYGGYTTVQLRKILGNDYESVWPALELVLELDGDKYFVPWLKVSISKREDYSKKQSDRIKKRWNNDGNTVVLPKKENEIVNENAIENKVEDEKKSEAKKSLIPDNFPFKSPYAIKAMEDYITHRRQLKVKTYTAIGLQKAMEEWEKWGEANFIEAVNNSIKNNYQGIFLPTQNPSSNGQQHKSPTVKRFTGGIDPPPPGTPFGQL